MYVEFSSRGYNQPGMYKRLGDVAPCLIFSERGICGGAGDTLEEGEMFPGMFDGMVVRLTLTLVGVGFAIALLLMGLFFLVRWVLMHLQWV